MRDRDRFEREMSEEMQFHIDEYTRELIHQGVPEAEAARRACVEFGPIAVAQEDCRKSKGWHLADSLSRDLRYAIRTLRKSPGFAWTAVATLALCMGANLAVFALVDAVLLKPLPFRDAGRLVTMYNTYPRAGSCATDRRLRTTSSGGRACVPSKGSPCTRWAKSLSAKRPLRNGPLR